MPALTPAEITALLGNTRDRGGKLRYLKAFLESGDMYRNLSDEAQFATKSESAIKQGFANAAKQIEDCNVKIVAMGTGDDVEFLLVNLDVHAEAASEDDES